MVTSTLVLNLGQINSETERGFSCRLTMLNVSTVWSHWRLQSGSSGDTALSTQEWALCFCQRSRGWKRNTPWGKVRLLLTTSPQGTCSPQGEFTVCTLHVELTQLVLFPCVYDIPSLKMYICLVHADWLTLLAFFMRVVSEQPKDFKQERMKEAFEREIKTNWAF